jgi:hypothetical protein
MENEILKACKDTNKLKNYNVLKAIQKMIIVYTEKTDEQFCILIHLIVSLRQSILNKDGLDLTDKILEALNCEFDYYKNLKCNCEKCRCHDNQSTNKDRERSE